jgi:predicted O-methyltransferase YrrM
VFRNETARTAEFVFATAEWPESISACRADYTREISMTTSVSFRSHPRRRGATRETRIEIAREGCRPECYNPRPSEVPVIRWPAAVISLWLLCIPIPAPTSPQPDRQKEIDARVTKFLEANRDGWRDMNVPEADGKALFDLVVKNGYSRAVEVGTSTGRSGIWTAWGLSRTNGKLITIEIDESRFREAKQNFEKAGVAAYVDARLDDAHELVPRLEGPIDFIFIDADKDWYTRYAQALIPKLRVGGCLAAHNVSPRGGRRQMTGDFYEYISGLPYMDTSFSAGVLVSYKRREK